MQSAVPRVTAIEAADLDITVSVWDAQSAVLSAVTRRVGDITPSDAAVARRIEKAVGIEPAAHRIFFGEVEVMLDRADGIQQIEFRTTPDEWEKRYLSKIPETTGVGRVRFDAGYDENGIAAIESANEFSWDEDTRTLSICLGTSQGESRWWRVADTMCLLIDPEAKALIEIRLENVLLRD